MGPLRNRAEHPLDQRFLLEEALWQLTDAPLDRQMDLRGRSVRLTLHPNGEMATAELLEGVLEAGNPRFDPENPPYWGD
jgi:hypothetical protein